MTLGEWSISLQPQEELAAFARFGNAVASLCVEKKGARACLKNHFRNLQAQLCGIFYPHSVAVARYAALIRIKSPTNWDSQLTKSLFQTRSKAIFSWNPDKHSPTSSARSTKRRVRGDASVSGS